jgi:hypothetical protein
MTMNRWMSTLALLLLLVPSGATGQKPTAETIAEVAALAQPGPEHALLSKLAGEWEQQFRLWPEPGADPVTSTGTGTATMVLGGRFLEIRSVVEMFGVRGESVSILGFDRRHERFMMLGMDTFGTHWVTASGPTVDAKTIVMRGEDVEPTIGHTQEYEFRLHMDGEDTWTLEIVFLDEMHTRGQGPFRMVEIVNRRRRS